MEEYTLDLQAIADRLLAILQKYELAPTDYFVGCATSAPEFDRIAPQHPDRVHKRVIRKTGVSKGITFTIQVVRQFTPVLPPNLPPLVEQTEWYIRQTTDNQGMAAYNRFPAIL